MTAPGARLRHAITAAAADGRTMSFLGVCPPGEQPARAHACHSNRMRIDEDAMRAGIAMYAALALEWPSACA